MLELCSHMKIDVISTVRKHVENLRMHVTPPVDSKPN